jgi:adenylate cyclase
MGIVSSPRIRRIGQGLLAALFGFVLSCVLYWTGMLDGFEARTYDWRARLLAGPNPAHPPIRVIFLDQQSLDWAAAENGLGWPWPREVYGAVVDFCHRAGAASLTFDVLFTEPSKYGVADDLALARAGGEYGRMVLPVFLGRETGERRSWPDFAPRSALPEVMSRPGRKGFHAPELPRASFPVAELAAQAVSSATCTRTPIPTASIGASGFLPSSMASRCRPWPWPPTLRPIPRLKSPLTTRA